MKRRRVKITGIGPVTPAGIGRKEFWKGILEPVSRVRPFHKLDAELGPFVAAYIDALHMDYYVSRQMLPKGAARHTLFAIAGAVLALDDAGISPEALAGDHAAIVAGACVMDFDGIIRTINAVGEKGIRGAIGRAIYTTNGAAIAASVGEVLRIPARTIAVQSSCCTGIDAVGFAARMVATGEVDIAICGGTDAPLYQCPLVELRAVGMTPGTTENAKKLDRPFDMWRTTGVVSEGACMFVIEPESSPRPGYTFVTGYAFENDQPGELCRGMSTAMRHALADAGVKTHEVECVNAWGPGHRLIDAAEAKMLKQVFGSLLQAVPSVSIKGSIGNPLGAAGAIQIAAAALAQRDGIIPPTVNWQFPDPDCPLNLCAQPRAIRHGVTLVNAHGLSGVNSSVILQRC